MVTHRLFAYGTPDAGPTRWPTDSVAGAYLELSEAEVLAADDYEVDDYIRTSVTLASGVESWVYIAADEI